MFANIHDDRSLEVAVAVESGAAPAREAFEQLYGGRMRAADVALQFYTVGGDAERFSGNVDGTAGTYRRMGILWSALPDDFVVVGSLADLELVLRKEKWGIVLTIEGAGPVGYELSTLENLYHLGLRSVCLTWFRANQVGDGVGESRNAGLTSFGRRLIAKLDELKMIIDVSQSSERTVREVLELSGRPLIASHSNAAGVYPHVRNLPDDVIREIGARGGVVGLTTYPAHVGRADVGLDDFIDHIIHVCEVAGENVPALGLNIMAGSDAVEQRFLGAANIEMTSLHLPQVRDLNDLPCLVDALAARGVSEKAVAAICFGNVVRVLRESL